MSATYSLLVVEERAERVEAIAFEQLLRIAG